MYMFFFFIVCFFSLLVLLINNVVMWWSIFLLMTLMFVTLNKSLMSYSSLFNYFILQESLGLIFLLVTIGYLQLIMLLLKVGVSPLHFWIFSVLDGVYGYNLVWFLTFQKMPFLFVMSQFFFTMMIFLLMIGLMICLLQMFLVKSFKMLLVLSSTESFNWLFLCIIFSFLSLMYMFIYYLMLMLMLIPKFEYIGLMKFMGWETALVFLNMPFTVNFFIKIYSLIAMIDVYSFFVLMLLMLLFLSVVSIGFWLINLSTKSFFYNMFNKFVYMYVFLSMLIVVL